MSKQLTIHLGGKDRVLDFGKWYFTKYYGESMGSDPLNSSDILLKPERQFDFVLSLVYAGMRTNYKVNKLAEDFTKDDVESWLGEKEDSEIADLVNKYGSLQKVEPGELEALGNGA